MDHLRAGDDDADASESPTLSFTPSSSSSSSSTATTTSSQHSSSAAAAPTITTVSGEHDVDATSSSASASAAASFASGYATLHERNMYLNRPPDFAALALKYDFFAPHVFTARSTGAACVDWRRADALHALTRALLLNDFGVEFDMPLNHLCPPVPQRLNYLLWIEDLLHLSGLSTTQYRLRGVDIGCGASHILALLGAAHLGFCMIGTEIDAESVASARANIARNAHLTELLPEVRHVPDRTRILCDVVCNDDDESFEFCCCNPPFFESLDETQLNKKRAAHATAGELTCPGGELAFVSRMLDDSTTLRYRFRWFTTMLGKKASLDALRRRIAATEGVTCVRHIEFQQGRQTRWGLAWSFDPALPASLLPPSQVRPRFAFAVTLAGGQTAASALETVAACLRAQGASRCDTDRTAYRIAFAGDSQEMATFDAIVQLRQLPGGSRELELEFQLAATPTARANDAASFSRCVCAVRLALAADAAFRAVRSL